MLYFVYIIKSLKHHRFYVGMTSDFEQRLISHNLGLNTSTKNGAPWIKVWLSTSFELKHDALVFERKIKKRGAQRFLDELL
jgi:predicted GIY-YIG superfamily endonuclease